MGLAWVVAVVFAVPAVAAPRADPDPYLALHREAEDAYQDLGRARGELGALQVETGAREAELAAAERAESAARSGTESAQETLRAARSAALQARQRVTDFYSGVTAEFRRGREFAVLDSGRPREYHAALPLLDFLADDQLGEVRSADDAVRRAESAVTGSADTVARAGSTRAEAAAALESARARRDAAARVLQDAQSRMASVAARLVTPAPRPPDSGLPGGDAGNVVRFALAQLGKPYVWGAEGPAAYDCSGLVLAAYRAIGASVPRTSAQQATVGVPVPRDQVRPGDLIFYYQPVSHVALAIDNSRAVHASRPGEPVGIAGIEAIGPVTGIRRLLR
ncbi:C40 family peptidase [Amycolatopsis granulosa]|uniref:C40 family peptidase n=1 Tax=Amycolatopsis granulosa TaxID=185684 RepID=UPI00141EFFBF|nr:C40 family peptidase [Amycolatopsis granulosa]NIH84031.1 cell wall-associated NlpC family hydrolase [Amycolatopsis granulosa]